jgi:signal transduction histidine kinase
MPKTVEAATPAPARCDPEQVRRALLNLGKNALQALGEAGGELTLSCRREGDEVVLVCRDSGPGIAAGHLPRLFEPFFTTREQGTGLGLALVAETARAHGGTVEVDSAPGAGARFTLRLPAAGA